MNEITSIIENLKCHHADEASYLEGLFLNREKFGIEDLWYEMDKIWDATVTDGDYSAFYTHPVWLANAIFTLTDPESKNKRSCFSKCIRDLGCKRIIDYGGGVGVFARQLSVELEGVDVAVFEPFANLSQIRVFENGASSSISFEDDLKSDTYDCITFIDVMEHLEDPVNVMIDSVVSLRNSGYILFANCFYPVIKCHLAKNMHYRYSWKILCSLAGLKYITSCSYGHIYQKINHKEIDFERLSRVNKFSKIFFRYVKLIPFLRRERVGTELFSIIQAWRT